MKVTVAQLGARRHYAVPIAFEKMGYLNQLLTDVHAGSWPIQWAGKIPNKFKGAMIKRILGRSLVGIPPIKIKDFSLFSFFCLLCRFTMQQDKFFLYSDIGFGKRMIKHLEADVPDILYCFSPQAFEMLKWCKRNSVKAILDQPIAPRKIEIAILRDEFERHPDWAIKSPIENEIDLELIKREKDEFELADRIVCGSEFVKDSMITLGYQPDKISVISSGIALPNASNVNNKHRDGPLRVLFVGQVSLRKGAPYLAECAKALKGLAIFRVVGPIDLPAKALAELKQHCEVLGSVPRIEVGEHFTWADVFFLPGLCEGSAMVTYEALAYGLPVVTTPNSGSIVRDGVDGFVSTAGVLNDFLSNLTQLCKNKALVNNMSESALKRIAGYTLNAYMLAQKEVADSLIRL